MFLKKLFGDDGKPKFTKKDLILINNQIQKIKEQIETMEKRENVLEKKIEKEEKKIKDCLSKGKRTQAKLCLKRKKDIEGQLTRLIGKTQTLEKQQATLEENASDMQVYITRIENMRVMKKTQNKFGGVDKMLDKLDEEQETFQNAKDISDALAQNNDDEMDEDELDDELAEFENQLHDKEKLDLSSKIKVPKNKLSVEEELGEKELDKKKEISEEDAELDAFEANLI